MKQQIIIILFFLSIKICFSQRIHVRHIGAGTMGLEIQLSNKASKMLYKQWFHSYEEDKNDSILTFRTLNFSFPPSRFRQSYLFLKNGNFTEFSFDNTDRPIQYKGKWIYDTKDKIIEITFRKINMKKKSLPLPQAKYYRKGYFFKIYTLESGLLRMKKFE